MCDVSGVDDAALERGDQRDRLDDRSREDRRVENVGARFAPIARIRRGSRAKIRRAAAGAERRRRDDDAAHAQRARAAPAAIACRAHAGPLHSLVLQPGRHRQGIILSPSVL